MWACAPPYKRASTECAEYGVPIAIQNFAVAIDHTNACIQFTRTDGDPVVSSATMHTRRTRDIPFQRRCTLTAHMPHRPSLLKERSPTTSSYKPR